MRAAEVYFKEHLAGIIQEEPTGYSFVYKDDYLNRENAKPVSLTMPLQAAKYESKVLFPFFDGLIPEGWLLNIAVQNWKLNSKDRFGLLLALCKDTIGCVSIIALKSE